MEFFDQYLETIRLKYPNPSPAMVQYIEGLSTICSMVGGDIETHLSDQQARWDALSDEEQVTCRVIAATL